MVLRKHLIQAQIVVALAGNENERIIFFNFIIVQNVRYNIAIIFNQNLPTIEQ